VDLKLVLLQVSKNTTMKKIFLLVSFICLMAACKEQTPSGLVLDNDTISSDSTYMAAAETPQPRAILIEESTGNKCSNCPAGKSQIDQMIQANPERIKVVALHFAGLEVDDPSAQYYSLENPDVRSLISYLDGDQGQPCAAFGREPIAGKYFILRGSGGNWTAALADELNKSTPVNLRLNSIYNAATNQATISTTLAFTDTTSDKIYLSLFLVEDGLVGKQDSAAGFSVVHIEDYEFNDVLRKAITPVIGSPVLNDLALKEKGRVFRRDIIFFPDAAWNKDKCRIVAVVHKSDASDKHVLNVAEAHLK